MNIYHTYILQTNNFISRKIFEYLGTVLDSVTVVEMKKSQRSIFPVIDKANK